MLRGLLGTFCLLSLLLPQYTVQAATLYLNPGQSEIRPGDTIVVAVRVDPDEDECINVVNGVIEYDPAIQPVDISRGRSILPFWVEEPTIDTANNRITFAGGVPNGYCGRIEGDPRLTNTVLEIIFQAPGFRIGIGSDNPTSTIRFSDETTVLLNDGRGTAAPLQTFGSEIFVHKKPGNQVRNEWGTLIDADQQIPEDFSIALQQDRSIFNGKYFIIFNTTDKQSGIDRYEVIEEPLSDSDLFNWGAADAPWVKARSPYLLSDQSLNSTIRVKAIDKSGNEYIATLVPDESKRTMSDTVKMQYSVMAAAGIILLVLVLAVVVIIRRRRGEYEYEEYYEEVEVEEEVDDEHGEDDYQVDEEK